MKTLTLLCVLLAATPDPGASLPQTNRVRYKGATAAEWGPGLLDADERTAEQAALALHNIGPEGLRFFYAALRDDKACFLALARLPHKTVAKYEKVFLPEIVRLLKHEEWFVRNAAGAALAACGFKASLPALKAARERERHPLTRRYMGEYIAALEKK